VKRYQTYATVLALSLFVAFGPSATSQQAPPAPIPLQGPTMEGVKFPHAAHTRVAGKCEICHHVSKPEKPLKGAQEACTDCHTKPPTPPVRVGLQAAFHNPAATAGLCITCHKTENAEGKGAPVKCGDCHKKDNS
jgi:Class III cytochrome C family